MKYFKQDNEKIICLLCSHHCKLKENKVGMCGVNQNVDGELKTLVYGYIAAFNVDPVEKKPLYHFLPNTKILSLGTVGCNFRCPFCQNWGISQHNNIDKTKYTSPEEVVQIAIKKGCKSIAYTYNEPTIFYPYIKDIAIEAKKYGIRSVMVTNGFESKEVIEDMKGVIDAVNVDLKSFDKTYYKKILKGDLDIQLENLIQMKKNGIWMEVTTLVIPTKNDSLEELTKIAEFIANKLSIDTPWHISAFHPDYKDTHLPRTPTDSLLLAQQVGIKAGLKHVYVGNAGLNNSNKCKECNAEVISRVTYKIHKDIRKDDDLCPNCSSKLDGIYKELDMSIRLASKSGSFYPDNEKDILALFTKCNNIIKQNNLSFTPPSKPKAIIVPHAGYIYSGFTANMAYSLLRDEYDKVIVIGPSHHVGLNGLSIADLETIMTPLGEIEIDTNISTKILDSSLSSFVREAHEKEHSTETQFPFIKHYLPTAKVVEIIYGKIDFIQIANLITKLMSDKTLIVISTDLSHFYDLQKAKKLDNICLESIVKQNNKIFDTGCEACGRLGVKAMNIVAKKLNLTTKLLDYRTSFDASNDEKRVVGYTSAVIF